MFGAGSLLLNPVTDVIQRLAYANVIAQHPLTPPYDYGTVAVIDGSKSIVTSLVQYL